jgi:hypothetical protein
MRRAKNAELGFGYVGQIPTPGHSDSNRRLPGRTEQSIFNVFIGDGESPSPSGVVKVRHAGPSTVSG